MVLELEELVLKWNGGLIHAGWILLHQQCNTKFVCCDLRVSQ